MTKVLILFMALQACGTSESIFELGPRQSMSITGIGPGQDAAYNPYGDEKSISIVKNLGSEAFSVRIQQDGEIIQQVNLAGKETREFVLEKDHVLYLDSEKPAKAKVTFKRFS